MTTRQMIFCDIDSCPREAADNKLSGDAGWITFYAHFHPANHTSAPDEPKGSDPKHACPEHAEKVKRQLIGVFT